ncbi:Dad1p KNAG_0H01410 [Huiozyma naganishii CBS 8797]|uniref:DASH complex subunit DAD1 n=1 Tax=Huiozyma naganishii (strain ATCC MYA-139 / BCRC 22969 / CBS 8797 / KCTC 17520 / NBRC 10181 / NCYC 3082 / Yp74L-3) TaxID=1071383 RepID=J7S8I3_HUIN7|nr:hypothetical protein KNAG_0H01410 [Kazachstania naganishii CBS 8797]CCK71554.1 hypothetical protein KNAG_0H01410 [Kazachstania naganishii CBS 8797]
MDTASQSKTVNSSALKGGSLPGLGAGDKYFLEQRSFILEDINTTMDSILNGLNQLNISLENSIAVGKEFESVTNLWKTFYNEQDSILDGDDDEEEDEDEEDENANVTKSPGKDSDL